MEYIENDSAELAIQAAEDEMDAEIAEIQERTGCDWQTAWHLAMGVWDEDDCDGHFPSHSGARNS